MTTRLENKNRITPSKLRESKHVKSIGRSKGTYSNRRSKYTNLLFTNSKSKKFNLGSAGKHKKITLAKVNLPEERD